MTRSLRTAIFVPTIFLCSVSLPLAAASEANGGPTGTAYPAPVAPRHGAAISFPGRFTCPNPKGLEPNAHGVSRAEVIGTVNRVEHAETLGGAEAWSDRAGWPIVRNIYAPGSVRPRGTLRDRYVDVSQAGSSVYAPAYRRACGDRLIAASMVVEWCAPKGNLLPVGKCLRHYPDLTSYTFVLHRHSRYMFWGLQGGA